MTSMTRIGTTRSTAVGENASAWDRTAACPWSGAAHETHEASANHASAPTRAAAQTGGGGA